MLQAVVVGIGGVLAPWDDVAAAEADAAAAWLAARGLAAGPFAAAARRRHGQPAWVAHALAEVGIALGPRDRRALVLATRNATPDASPSPHRAALADLARVHTLAALDAGPGPQLDAWTHRLGLGDLLQPRLWTEDLGAAGRPPRRAPFRFLARRLEVRAADCLYVAGRESLAMAARAAGWRVAQLAAPAAAGFDWDACIAAATAPAGGG